MKITYSAVLLLTLFSSVAFGADISGNWIGTLRTNEGGAFDLSVTLNVENGAVTGTMRVAGSEAMPLKDLKIEGDHISFSVTRSNQERTLKMNFNGTVQGDEMKLARQIEGSQRVLDVTLTRKQ